MTRALATSMTKNERIRLTPNYIEVDLKPSFNDLLLNRFIEKMENDPSWSPLLTWYSIVENIRGHLKKEPTDYDIMMATIDRPPKVGKAMTEWFKSLLPPYIVMTNILTDREGWRLLCSLMKYKDDRNSGFVKHAGSGIDITISMKRPVNENELLKKIYEQGGLGITRYSEIEHVIVLLESSGIPYEFEIQESDAFDHVHFEIAGLLKLY